MQHYATCVMPKPNAQNVRIMAVTTERCGGLDVLIVDVPKARTLVATTAGRYVRRAIGVDGSPQCLPLLPHEAQARTTLLGGLDLSVSPLTELSIADVDPTEFDRFRRLAGGGGDGHLAELSDLDLLSALGFLVLTVFPAARKPVERADYYGFALNLAVPLQQRYGAPAVMCRALGVAAVATAPFGLAGLADSRWDTGPVLAVTVLGVVGTGAAFVIMAALVGRVGATRGGVAIYLA